MLSTTIQRRIPRLGHAVVGLLMALLVSGCLGDGPHPRADSRFAVLPDTQIYTERFPNIIAAQGSYLFESREDFAFALHEGDLTENNSDPEWGRVRDAFAPLEGDLDFIFVTGNHDMGPNGSAANRDTGVDQYMTFEEVSDRPSFLEGMDVTNTAHLVALAGQEWLVLALEFGPREASLTWAQSVLAAHQERPTIVLTHAHTYSDDTRYDSARYPDQLWNPKSYGLGADANDAQTVWERLIEPNPQIELVLSGHVLNDGAGRITTPTSRGFTHEVLANYQMNELGGAGFLRIIDVYEDRFEISSYSPYLDEFNEEAEHRFDLAR